MVYGAGDFVTPDAVQALEIIQAQVRDVGFDMQFTPITLSDYYAGVHRGPHDYEVQPAYWTASSAEVFKISWKPDAGGAANVNNASHFQSPEVWSLIQAADQTFDDARRKELYGEAEKILTDSAAVVGFIPLPTTLASSAQLKGVAISDAVGEPIFYDAYFAR